MDAPIEKNAHQNHQVNDTMRRGFRHILAGVSALASTDAPTDAALELAELVLADLSVTVALLRMRAERGGAKK